MGYTASMPTALTGTLEERVTALESEVTRLKEQVAPADAAPTETPAAAPLDEARIIAEIERIRRQYSPAPRPKPTAPDFLERFAGAFADDPAFDRVVRFSEERRERERREANREP